MNVNVTEYGADDIQHLPFQQAVRIRISMYLGSDNTEGIYQGLKEIINNSTDESNNGFGDKIEISVNETLNKVKVRDYGRGVPFGINKEGKNVLVAVYTEEHTGGKFKKGVYKTSAGLNGIGGSCTCLSSDKFTVTSYRGDKKATAIFEKGVLLSYNESSTTEKSGTVCEWIPSKEVFKNMTEGFSYKRICDDIENISYLNKGIHFVIKNEETGEEKEFYSKNGIADFIIKKAKNPLMKPIITKAKDVVTGSELEVAFLWTAGVEQSFVFVNGLYCPDGGTPITGAKTTLTTFINKLSGQKLDGELIRRGLVYAINCKVDEPSFEGQTKSKINNNELRSLTSTAFKDGLEQFAQTLESEKIIEMLVKYQKAEKAADRARKQILDAAKEIEKNASKKVFNTDKLADAEFLGQDSILLLVEGDSASGSMKQARDYTKYGVLALRGKIINPLSNNDEDIADNEEVKLFLKAMNIVPGKYDAKKLRYGKVAICVDADSDGYHIALLIMSLLYYFAPQFIEEGRLCWLRSPLYTVDMGKTKKYYFTDEEMESVKPTLTGVKQIHRNKGLGELDPKDATASMFTEEFQHMDIIRSTDEGFELLKDLMGDDPKKRKEYIFNNIDFDIIRE